MVWPTKSNLSVVAGAGHEGTEKHLAGSEHAGVRD